MRDAPPSGIEPEMFGRVALIHFLLQRSWEPGLDQRRCRDTVTALLDRVLPR